MKKLNLGIYILKGNQTYSDFRLRFLMKETKQQRWYYFGERLSTKDKLDLDKEKIIEFYHNKGHRDFVIVSDSILYDGNSKYLDVILFVDEGTKI